MKNRLEISLKEANKKPVGLNSMSLEALDSFITVVSSLKSIALSAVPSSQKELLSFSIVQGSVACVVDSPDNGLIESIHSEIDTAIKGESDNEEITYALRQIQAQIKRDNLDYKFSYINDNKVTNIHTPLKTGRKVLRRRNRRQHSFKLKIISGFLNQIGGKNPNYHFSNGDEITTIGCTLESARQVNKYLYKEVASLLLCKEWDSTDKKDEYTHIAVVVNDVFLDELKAYLNQYNGEENLVKKLTLTYDFVDNIFSKVDNGQQILKYLLLGFNNKNFHLSELKTLLVISKPFKEHEAIMDARVALLETYQRKRINAKLA